MNSINGIRLNICWAIWTNTTSEWAIDAILNEILTFSCVRQWNLSTNQPEIGLSQSELFEKRIEQSGSEFGIVEGDDVIVGTMVTEELDVAVPHDWAVEYGTV